MEPPKRAIASILRQSTLRGYIRLDRPRKRGSFQIKTPKRAIALILRNERASRLCVVVYHCIALGREVHLGNENHIDVKMKDQQPMLAPCLSGYPTNKTRFPIYKGAGVRRPCFRLCESRNRRGVTDDRVRARFACYLPHARKSKTNNGIRRLVWAVTRPS
jgi:hypothetical protein